MAVRFVSPGWLIAVAFLIPIFFLVTWDERRRRLQFARFANEKLWSVLAPELDPRARERKALVWLGVMAFLFLALARPQWGTHEEVSRVSGMDIVFAVDVSNSMETEDIVPSRLKKAKHVIRSIIERLGGDRVGLVAFAGSSYVSCPLTTDSEYVLEQVQILSPKLISNQGTDIGGGLETARRALERGAEESAKSGETQVASQAVVLISDGEDHEEQAVEAAKKIKQAGIKFYILGAGTQKGGPVPVRDDQGNLLAYKKDRRGQPVVSSFNPEMLVSLAGSGGGKFWNITAAEDEINELLRDVGGLNRSEYAERRYLVFEERYQIPLAIALLLLLIEISLPARRIVAVLLLIFATARAEAVPLDTYLENQKGLKALEAGKLDDAEKSFGKAQALDPTLPQLNFNEGIVQLQKGDTEGAAKSFNEAARQSLIQEKGELASKSFFNLGATLAKKGDFKGAVRSYQASIESAQKSGNEALEADARKNLQLLIQEKQKQEQEQEQQKQDQQQKQNQKNQSSDQNKDQKDQGDKEKKDQQDQKDQQDKKDGKNQDQKPYQDPQQSGNKQKFQSKKLSHDDAERVMAELKNRERELQGRLKKHNGNANPQDNQKDW